MRVTVLAIVFLTSCASAPHDVKPRSEASQCAKKDGRMVAYGQYGEQCEWPSTDAGTACRDSSQCQGYCDPVVDSAGKPADRGAPSRGVCSPYESDSNFPNCGVVISNGVVEGAPCVD